MPPPALPLPAPETLEGETVGAGAVVDAAPRADRAPAGAAPTPIRSLSTAVRCRRCPCDTAGGRAGVGATVTGASCQNRRLADLCCTPSINRAEAWQLSVSTGQVEEVARGASGVRFCGTPGSGGFMSANPPARGSTDKRGRKRSQRGGSPPQPVESEQVFIFREILGFSTRCDGPAPS